MRMVQITLTLVIALLIGTMGVAQEKQKKKGGRGRLTATSRLMMRMQTLRSALDDMGLTAEQEEKLGKIREQLGPKMKEVFGNVKDVLTEEQWAAAEEAGREARDAGKEGRAVFVAIESAIKLTDEQKENMADLDKPVLRLQRQMMKQITAILTPEQQEKLKKKMSPAKKKKRKKGGKKDA